MRVDNLQFKSANEAVAKSPRYVVAILFDVGSLYITSHADIASVPGIVLEGALQAPSSISQRIVPDEGRTEIGTFSFDVVDLESEFTDEVRAKLSAGDGLRGRTVQLWCGYRGFDFSAFQLFQTQVVTGCEYHEGIYSVTCHDVTRQQRTNIAELKSTTLNASCTADDTTITVVDTSAFLPVTHGAHWTDAPSSTVFYFKINREIIRATAKTATTFVGCTRGQFNTQKAAHPVDSTAPQERRPKVEEFFYLDLPAPKAALALLTGAIFATWPANLLGTAGDVETDSNADGVANGWTALSNDGGRVQTPSLVGGSAPFVGNAQRLAVTSVTNSNPSAVYWDGQMRAGVTFTTSAYIRANVAKVQIVINCRDAAGNVLSGGTGTSAVVAGDSIAHFAQVTVTAPPGTEVVRVHISGINAASEFLEFDRVMLELGTVVHGYTSDAIQGLLPQHWHVGIAPKFVRFADFTGIGSDLWDLADDSNGFITRFEGLAKTDGKGFLEKQIYLLLGAYQPVYADGSIGLKRLPAMVSDASPIAVLTEREVVSINPLKHDYASLHNRIRVTWAFDIGINDFTRDTLFIDGTSVEIHGQAPLIEYEFRGLHSGIHTDNMIRTRLDAIRDAYSYPPQRTSVTVLPSLNRFETGDVFRLQVKNVRDFAGATVNIDRSFLVTYQSIDFATGELSYELFGSTLRPDPLAPSTELTAPLADAFYTSAGVTLSSVVAMTGNTVNAGTHSITGNADMNASGAVVYHTGDLVIPSGATINISANVQLRVRGFITLNGAINGTGGGLAGVADPGGALTTGVTGNPGFIGNSRGWDGINVMFAAFPWVLLTIPPGTTRGRNDAWPDINIAVNGLAVTGIPSDLRGTGGGPGGRVVDTVFGSGFTNGGTGAAGGAGLAIICRGMSFGVSASITLDGADSATTTPVFSGFLYPGAGGAGGPGSCLILLDGNAILIPNAAGRFFARTGTVPLQGVEMPERRHVAFNVAFTAQFGEPPLVSGYRDEQLISDLDLSTAALRIKYIPFTQTPAPNQDRLPAALLGLTVTPAAGFNTIRATLPELGTFDVVDFYAAVTNDRAGAVLVFRGRGDEFQHNLPVLATRYYWGRTTRISETGLELHSEFTPVSSTAGVSGTTLNPGGWTPATTAAGGATMVVTSSTIEKSGGTLAWDSQCYSLEKYAACYVSFRANGTTHDFLIGLNTDPTTDASYASLDYAFYCTSSSGTLQIYEGGSLVASFGTYDATTVLAITYDGARIRYLKNGVTLRTVVSLGLSLALDSSFYTPGAKAVDVKFGPQGFTGRSAEDVAFLGFEEPWEERFVNRNSSGSLVATYPANGDYGGKVISAQNQLWIAALDNVAYDPTALYRITTKIRRTAAASSGAGTEFVFCGVEGVAADGVTLINVLGANSFNTQHYNCAANFDMSTIAVNTWKTFTGYFKGHATSGFGVAPGTYEPTPLYTGVKYFRPVLIMNYNNGNGTMECDFVRVEKLVTPDDADNTDLQRLVPDAEFIRSNTDDRRWQIELSISNPPAKPVLAITGGAIGGMATLKTGSAGGGFGAILSRRDPAAQAFPGTYYTGSVRWRRNTTLSGSGQFTANICRHAQPDGSVFLQQSDTYIGLGGFELSFGQVNARTVSVWQEDLFVAFLPRTTGLAAADSPYIAAYARISSGGTSGQSIDVDFLNITPGITIDPPNLDFTASATLTTKQIYKNIRYSHASTTGTFELPAASDEFVGARIFFEQMDAGVLSVSVAGGNTLESSPNTTGTRSLEDKYARAYAECVSSTNWRLVGDLA